MSASVLVAYASRYGSTQEVAEAVAAALRESGLAVDTCRARDVGSLAGYAAVVLGAPLYMYRWHKDARRFLSRHLEALRERPVAVFALGPTHEPYDEKEWQDSRGQLAKELAKYTWLAPVAVEIFGGRFDPEKLPFPVSLMAGQEPASDIRDWAAIHAWAGELAVRLEPTSP
ncbi:MAG: flavodoxin domain-containing protein [Anaerolineae bacterium]|jgi:menaquinone-dependent protoporphyrinogen oxidase